MKKLLKLVTIFGLTICCLLAAIGCNPARRFAGEYEWKSYGGVSIVDTNEELADEMETDANLVKAIDDIKTMVGTKIELTAGYILFKDSDTKFNVARYDLSTPYETGNYEISTNDEKLMIRIVVYKSTYEESNIMQVYTTSYTTASDGKDYYCNIIIQFERGENK